MTTLLVNLADKSYKVTIGNGILAKANDFFNLNRRVAIITDRGTPSEYAEIIKSLAKEGLIITVPEGEGSKSIEQFSKIHTALLEFGMTRCDCMVAVGGGVVSDLCGFVASTFMRGIDFYNIPTTLLSMVDASVGGKTAINHGGIKNIIGAFHQPKGVLIDTDTLKTLPWRHIASGAAEVIKMALTFDRELFKKLGEEEAEYIRSEEAISAAVALKIKVVEEDERESGLRKVLNFGHTFGHAIEANEELGGLYHGECVALGMLYTSSAAVRGALIPVLEKYSLPTLYHGDVRAALKFITHDKKCEGSAVSAIFVDEVGSFRIENLAVDEFAEIILSLR